MERYFTEGELLPWKGKWFVVHLMEAGERKWIELEPKKPTDREVKLQARQERWQAQHPKAEHDRYGRRLPQFNAAVTGA